MRLKAVPTALALAALAFAAGGASTAFAHHSAAMYDFTRNVWVDGVVKSIRVINPHMSLTLTVSTPKGKSHDIDFEGHSVNNFYRAGWRPGIVKPGDKIKVRYNPRKDGQDGGFVNGFVTAQGREIAFRVPGAESSGAPQARTHAGQ
jgi:hypothetical protein